MRLLAANRFWGRVAGTYKQIGLCGNQCCKCVRYVRVGIAQMKKRDAWRD